MKFLKKNMSKFVLLLFLISFLSACESAREGFKLKKNNSDEFLVEKKNPLVMPPNYKDLPKPKDFGSYSDQITFVADRPGHDARYAIDPTLIKHELGWRPSLTIEEGLEKTVKWYVENESWRRPLLELQGVTQRLGAEI